eukprot:6178223-Pleurochrysis_carterae.AAC.1
MMSRNYAALSNRTLFSLLFILMFCAGLVCGPRGLPTPTVPPRSERAAAGNAMSAASTSKATGRLVAAAVALTASVAVAVCAHHSHNAQQPSSAAVAPARSASGNSDYGEKRRRLEALLSKKKPRNAAAYQRPLQHSDGHNSYYSAHPMNTSTH